MIKTSKLTNDELKDRLKKLSKSNSEGVKNDPRTTNYDKTIEDMDDEFLIDIEELLAELEQEELYGGLNDK